MKFGLIGHPVEHSLSPALFKAGYDGRYPYDLIETPEFEEAYRRFIDGYNGINVTAPFKELALRKADIVSEECRLVGAANLLVKTPQGIAAYNSDFRGLVSILELIEVSGEGGKSVLPPWPQGVGPATKSWEGFFYHPHPKRQNTIKRALIVGWGGASKAAKAAAETLGYETIVINRTQYDPEIKPLSDFRDEFLKADIIIYNLPVRIDGIDGLTQDDISACGRKIILEANYRNPSFDKVLIGRWRQANQGIGYIDGRTWLLAQAVTGYELFTGEMPDCKAMERKLI